MILELPLLLRKKSSDHFKDLHKMKVLTNFDINLASGHFWEELSTKGLTHNLELLLEMTSYSHQNMSGASIYKDL